MPLDVCPGAQHLLGVAPSTSARAVPDRLRAYDLFDFENPHAMRALAERCVHEQSCRCDQSARRVHAALEAMAEVEDERLAAPTRTEMERAYDRALARRAPSVRLETLALAAYARRAEQGLRPYGDRVVRGLEAMAAVEREREAFGAEGLVTEDDARAAAERLIERVHARAAANVRASIESVATREQCDCEYCAVFGSTCAPRAPARND